MEEEEASDKEREMMEKCLRRDLCICDFYNFILL
jgi:hypothetical protein